MTNDNLLSRTIDYLRFPLTVGVVFIHFSLHEGLTIHGIKHGLENPEWFFFIVNFFSQVLARIAVPLFFIISGFLFFYGNDFNRYIYIRKLHSRTKSLLIPFLLWNIIAIIWQCKCFLPGISSFYPPVEFQISFTRIINTFLCNTNDNGILVVGPPSTGPITGLYPIDVPLWYVRDLMVMVVLSPILYLLISKTRQWLVIVLGVIWYWESVIIPKENYLHIYMGSLINASFFFSWGALNSILKKNLIIHFRKIRYAPIIYIPIAITDALSKGLEINEYIHKAGILVGVITAVVIVSLLLESNRVKERTALANSSFFIFALHFLFIGDMGKFAFKIFHIQENNPYAMLVLYFAVPLFSIALCLVLYVLLKLYFPKICNLLTGGR